MSRKNRAPKRIFYPDSQYGSAILSKFINFIMYDGKRSTAEKTIYSVKRFMGEKYNNIKT